MVAMALIHVTNGGVGYDSHHVWRLVISLRLQELRLKRVDFSKSDYCGWGVSKGAGRGRDFSQAWWSS
ncbi:hypothetical protein L1887_25655 [Cichorium endivia]|nr:hypothetical protein L1887_25655 [Cichorium endivia]